MRKVLRGVIGFYGANPLHLLALCGCFAITGYVGIVLAVEPSFSAMLVWFAASVVGHDVVLFPLYALADRSLAGAVGVFRGTHRRHPSPGAVNYLRMPVLGSGLLFLLFFPGILEQGTQTYLAATGQTQEPFLGRWLLITAVLFGTSAVLYAFRLGRSWAGRHRAGEAHEHAASESDIQE